MMIMQHSNTVLYFKTIQPDKRGALPTAKKTKPSQKYRAKFGPHPAHCKHYGQNFVLTSKQITEFNGAAKMQLTADFSPLTSMELYGSK